MRIKADFAVTFVVSIDEDTSFNSVEELADWIADNYIIVDSEHLNEVGDIDGITLLED